MFKVQTLNKIAPEGLALFPKDKYEFGPDIKDPDLIIVRSADLLNAVIPESVLAIARAGAGYNNIPLEICDERGIVVFNTPGANAASVKELVLASLFLSSRKIIDGIIWTKELISSKVHIGQAVEKGKSLFEGPEIKGKTLGVVGLGAIGVMVANDALALGMDVIGYDPYISIDAAWNLSRMVQRAETLETLLQKSDYVTIHIPYSDKTKDLFNKEKLALMKKGSRLINLARGGLAKEADVIAALDAGIISSYITDFPTDELIRHKNVICFPHLGASTPEAEINCAKMAVTELVNFLEHGIIRNSVNYPSCSLEQKEKHRLIVANKNIPNMVGQITTLLARENINITDLINHHRGDQAFNIIDTQQDISERLIDKLKHIEGIVRVRTITKG
ncbi:MAG: 3-phosphoglycerate dehydrogenase [Spirochaetaceae bacterium]|jgi:D-3-phosphoglycerate dehydrogenase|nr:3-phosphoglycerate dehydrogenase [Spirochaetaceae bacterium]